MGVLGAAAQIGLLAALLAGAAGAGEQQCSSAPALAASSNYSAVFSQRRASNGALGGLLSRSVSRRDHAVLDGSSRAWSTMSGWGNCTLAYLVQPSRGANHVMYLVDMREGAAAPTKSPIMEHFLLVLEGRLEVEVNGKQVLVPANHFAYLPPASEEFMSQTVTSSQGAKALVFERVFGKAEGMPVFKTGSVDAAPAAPAGPPGSGVEARHLLPDGDEWDFDVIVADVPPGQAAGGVVAAAHYNNHAALLLAGQGIYKLGDSWYPVCAGDAVWSAPYVPHWFAALGGETARLVAWRDRNVDPFFLT